MKIFGTDGIREVAGEGWLSPDRLPAIGWAVASWLDRRRTSPGQPLTLLFASDGRASAPAIKAGLLRGLASWKISVTDVGLCPTPGGAFLTRHRGLQAGIVISASHNPAKYNGIKIFSSEGEKLSEIEERALEDLIRTAPREQFPAVPLPPNQEQEGDREYLAGLREHLGSTPFLTGKKIVLDTAHGAASHLAPLVFRNFGAEVIVTHDRPDGTNINHRCGATCLEPLLLKTTREKAWLGISFDGDGDRAILCDAASAVGDGDQLLAYLADRLSRAGRLGTPCVVSTVMANLGLEIFLRERGIALFRTPVGDKHVYHAMKEGNLLLGGEQSGHVVIRDGFASTGDGIYTALFTAKTLVENRDPPALAFTICPLYPQKTVSLPVKRKLPLDQVPEIVAAEAATRAALGDKGRLLLRYSGTEPVLRIMVEAENPSLLDRLVTQLTETCREALG